VRAYIDGEPEYYLDITVGEYYAPPHKATTVEKCTFCYNLIDRGEVPACMDLCPARARYWGDFDDPSSEVSKAINGRDYTLLQESAGTEPKVYYLT
jgi:molybdopterin-containing oxidoreductase family iron-sulfur binding subunit